MDDFWFEVSEGASMDGERAALIRFRHLLDDPKTARLAVTDMQLSVLEEALGVINALISGQHDIRFRFITAIDGLDAYPLLPSGALRIEYSVEGQAQLVECIKQVMTLAKARCLKLRPRKETAGE